MSILNDKDEKTTSLKNSVTEPRFPVYEGYTFFQADPIQGQSATWTRVERTVMHLSQTEYFKMVQKRANKKSAAQQYQNISSNTRRAHINQLIDEQRRKSPLVEWSCVYAKEHAKPSKARNACQADYETVSMDVIIMQRSAKTMHPRTPMGDLVDLGVAFRTSSWPQSGGHPSMPGQNGDMPRSTAQGLQSQLALSSDHLQAPHQNVETILGERDEPREFSQSTATLNVPPSPAFSATRMSDTNFEPTSGCSPKGSSDSNDEPMNFDPSDESSETDSSDIMETKYRERRSAMSLLRQHTGSPVRRERIYGPHFHANSHSRSLDGRHEKNFAPRDQFLAFGVKRFVPRKHERARSRGSASAKRYRIQLMSGDEIRSRLLDHREARISLREQRQKKTFYEAPEHELQQSVNDNPPVCRCACRC
ncbi:uncharacterized protein N7529_002612 [Penicillium soppii]|uniref:uncharacterized protein n=1 Tax=Penicillium soppii TaxID=69789 RepID=UPI0025471B72|nr:uncharacterized protein N7529_002612 [Penicillium soppii]KAJ5874182.1 hypothetical protein N7529_002612 [Penicillium soppii]